MPIVEMKCKNCSDKFYDYDYRYRVCCSMRCSNLNRGKEKVGKLKLMQQSINSNHATGKYTYMKVGKNKTLVDEDVYNAVSDFTWWINGDGYVVSSVGGRKGKTVFLHRLVNNTPSKYITDHINRDRLDNRRCNLRNADHSLNALNSKRSRKIAV